MAVGAFNEKFLPVNGVRLSSVASGIKKSGNDLVLIEFASGSKAAGVFTNNAFAAAPVQVCKSHLEEASPRYFLVNSGNANAATGKIGVSNAIDCCEALGSLTAVDRKKVLPFSTGVIGEHLPADRIKAALPKLIEGLKEGNWLEAARGIMTTDTRPKIASRSFDIDGTDLVVTGIAKGAGMIEPHMATLLVFIATDAGMNSDLLRKLLRSAADQSFNRITVDSDTSTNDSCMLVATSASGFWIEEDTKAAEIFLEQLTGLCIELAQGVIKDAEGVTRFVEVMVEGGTDQSTCLEIAYSIANSPLVKSAVFAGDANWGRIVMAIGKTPFPIDPELIDVYLGSVRLMHAGEKDASYKEEDGAREMAGKEIQIRVNLNQGSAVERVWTTDLSYDYIKINADYRS